MARISLLLQFSLSKFSMATMLVGLLFSAGPAAQCATMELELEKSTSLQEWESIPITPDLLTLDGKILVIAGDSHEFFRLRIRGAEEDVIPEGFSLIPAGSFTMGSPGDEPQRHSGEGPQHEVTLTRSFYLQQTPVTWGQWNEVRDWALQNGYTDLPSGRKGSHGDSRNSNDDPVTMVSWYDAVKWLNAKSEIEGLNPAYRLSEEIFRVGVLKFNESHLVSVNTSAAGYRLPTEAEWEYGVRAETITAFYSGPLLHTSAWDPEPNLDRIGWYGLNSDPNLPGSTRQSHPVGQKEPNDFGLYDMSGNVSEWCWDFEGSYNSAAETDPMGADSGLGRIARGGDWFGSAASCRSARRWSDYPDERSNITGFRPARTVP